MPEEQRKPKIGIITALVEEYTAMKTMLHRTKQYWSETESARQEYQLGELPSAQGDMHPVVLARTGMGTNIAALRAGQLLQDFPSVDSILMVGIAGGVPHPEKPEDHVRLGDIVVSGPQGVVQYDYVKEETQEISYRHPPRPPSAMLLNAVESLKVEALEKNYPWEELIKHGQQQLKWKRPSPKTDERIEHPVDPLRRRGQPKIFMGTVACANTLLKNKAKRNRLRDKFGIKAVEMEASGIADATWHHQKVGYLAIRGICDYCDEDKNDNWHHYAAIVAAAYASALVATMPGGMAETELDKAGEETDSNPDESSEIKDKCLQLNGFMIQLSNLAKKAFDCTERCARLTANLKEANNNAQRIKLNQLIGNTRSEQRKAHSDLESLHEAMNVLEEDIKSSIEATTICASLGLWR